MRKLFCNFHENDHGATMVEYGLMVAVIAIVVVLGGITLGVSIDDTIDDTTRCSDAPSVANCVVD